jgi:hypothetical protein
MEMERIWTHHSKGRDIENSGRGINENNGRRGTG